MEDLELNKGGRDFSTTKCHRSETGVIRAQINRMETRKGRDAGHSRQKILLHTHSLLTGRLTAKISENRQILPETRKIHEKNSEITGN